MSFSTYETEKLITYLPEALFLEDLEGNILEVNAEACELLGYREEELLAMNVQGLVPEGAPSFLPDSPEGKIGTLEGINRGVWSKLRGEKKGKRRLYCGVPVK